MLVHIAVMLSASLIIALPSAWGALALRYQMPGSPAVKFGAAALWLLCGAIALIAVWQGRAAMAMAVFAVLVAGLAAWWQRLAPSNERQWADDVAHMADATVEGNLVTLRNVRNFDWRSPTDYTVRWETRRYDLDKLCGVDMIMSYWSRRSIAHTLISFAFDDGQHLVFSVEIRRERQEKFSEVGGFFKEFELCIIAADERDVIRLRTNARRENTYLYRIVLPARAMRAFFLAYLDEARDLAKAPRFYHSITDNCTTVLYRMMNRIVGHLPLDVRILFSGYFPEYVYRIGGLDRRYSLEELRERGYISERARVAARNESFSADIRAGILPLQPATEAV
jgi:hypothetical protein